MKLVVVVQEPLELFHDALKQALDPLEFNQVLKRPESFLVAEIIGALRDRSWKVMLPLQVCLFHKFSGD